jgi:hypothetical protein
VKRSVEVAFHDAVDLDLAFLPVLDAPSVTISGSTPYLTIETHAKPLAGAIRHDVRARVAQGRRREQRWVTSIDAAVLAGGEIVTTMPALSHLPGWKNAWALPAGQPIEVTATAYEAEAPLGDGTRVRASTRSVWITPP